MKHFLTIFIYIFCILSGYAANDNANGIQNAVNKPVSLIDTNKLKGEINSILKKKLPDAEIISFKQTVKNGVIIYDCNVSYQGSIIKLYINPQNGAISGKLDDRELLDEKITKSVINKGTKEVNNVLKQIKLDASFSDVKYNKKDKTLEGNILYMDSKYYFKMNAATGEIIEMKALD